MTPSNFNSAVIMGFFAAAIGLSVVCYWVIQDNGQNGEVVVDTSSDVTYVAVSAEDIIAP